MKKLVNFKAEEKEGRVFIEMDLPIVDNNYLCSGYENVYKKLNKLIELESDEKENSINTYREILYVLDQIIAKDIQEYLNHFLRLFKLYFRDWYLSTLREQERDIYLKNFCIVSEIETRMNESIAELMKKSVEGI